MTERKITVRVENPPKRAAGQCPCSGVKDDVRAFLREDREQGVNTLSEATIVVCRQSGETPKARILCWMKSESEVLKNHGVFWCHALPHSEMHL